MNIIFSRKPSRIIILAAVLLLTGCAGGKIAPEKQDNICLIFKDNKKWYLHALNSEIKWGVPISVMMAIMRQESGFDSEAKPPRTTCLFIFPGPRPSSAYGYPQALDSTWENYKRATGNKGADRNDFQDAIDFIGWYLHNSLVECKIPKNDAYKLYLSYHEGHKGFLQKTWKNKGWLKQTAKNVQNRADQYYYQLAECEKEFQRSRGSCLGLF